MTMHFSRRVIVLIPTFALMFTSFQSHSAEAKPNIVLILADDVGVNDLSLYGSKFFETPHIDKLAKQGMKFTQAYSASPLCSPTRASIMTGLYPARIGITAPDCHLPKPILDKRLIALAGPNQKALTAESLTRFDTSYYTLPEALKAAGYTTAHFGKWHLGPEPYSPLEHGFEIDIPHTHHPSPLGAGFFYPFHVWKNHGKRGDNLEDLLVDEAVKFIEEHQEEPFFLNYWSFQAHSPWQAKVKQIEKYRAKADPDSLQRNPVYAGMIETLDEAVGRIVTALEKAKVRDNTIIVFTSDNGPYFKANQEVHMPAEFHQTPVTSASPLREGKGTIYEGGTRVPLIISWPAKIESGSESHSLTQSVDFFPTFVELLELKLPADVCFDGKSMRPILEGGKGSRDEVFCHFPTGMHPACSIRQGDWKLIRWFCDNDDQTDRFVLYNLANDIGETEDQAALNPILVKQLSARLEAFLAETAAVVPQPNPRFDSDNVRKK
jgi:arylsulfatase A-like enzyme